MESSPQDAGPFLKKYSVWIGLPALVLIGLFARVGVGRIRGTQRRLNRALDARRRAFSPGLSWVTVHLRTFAQQHPLDRGFQARLWLWRERCHTPHPLAMEWFWPVPYEAAGNV